MDNPEKLTALATQDTRPRKKDQYNKTCVGHHFAHVNIDKTVQ